MANLIRGARSKGAGSITQGYMQQRRIQPGTNCVQVAVQIQVRDRQQNRRWQRLASNRRCKCFSCVAIQAHSYLSLLVEANRNIQASVFVKVAERQPFGIRNCSSGEFVRVQVQRPVAFAGENLEALAETINSDDIQIAVAVDVAERDLSHPRISVVDEVD